MSEPTAFWVDLNRDLADPDVAADFAANQAEIQAHDQAVNYAAAINAPLSPATIEALAAALKSGTVPTRKVRRRTDA